MYFNKMSVDGGGEIVCDECLVTLRKPASEPLLKEVEYCDSCWVKFEKNDWLDHYSQIMEDLKKE